MSKRLLICRTAGAFFTICHNWARPWWSNLSEQGPFIQVILAPNPNTASAVELLMPDGQRMVSHVVGLSYYDAASGKSVLIAPIKDAQGALLPGNDQVVYPDAFSNLSADLRYRVTLSGLEQDTILREQPPAPDAFGLDPASTRLEMMTEFEQAPNPTIEMRVLKEESDMQVRQAMVEPDLVDDYIDFGPMQIGIGRAFQLTDQPEDPALPIAPVAKHWENAGGRLLLFESVELRDIAGVLKDLPANKQANLDKPDRSKVMASRREILPARAEKRVSTNPVLIAQAPLKGKGLVLDYNIQTSQTSFTFEGTTTYFVTNSVTLSG